MHIPDGYLSPQTCGVLTASMVPVWSLALRRTKTAIATKAAPSLALAAAFAFVLMMFNVPVPGGTTAHASGGVAIAVLLGPWAAVIAMSVALAIQALLFGDGGVLAFGANALNLAFAMPLAGFGVYRLVAGRSSSIKRRAVAAGIGGYIGLNLAALLTAVQLGAQAHLFTDASGVPRYAPYGFREALAAMGIAHLAAGFVEAAITAGVVSYALRSGAGFGAAPAPQPRSARSRHLKIALLCIGVMAAASPLGLLAPGGAFGEDSAADFEFGKYGLNAVPSGLARYNGFWDRVVFDGYGFADGSNPHVAYVLSAVVGIAAAAAVIFGAVGTVRLVGRRAAVTQK